MPTFKILIHSWGQKKKKKKSSKEWGQASRGGVWDTTTILFLAKMEAFADIVEVQPESLVAPDSISVGRF